jgi:hypothetical protein
MLATVNSLNFEFNFWNTVVVYLIKLTVLQSAKKTIVRCGDHNLASLFSNDRLMPNDNVVCFGPTDR